MHVGRYQAAYITLFAVIGVVGYSAVGGPMPEMEPQFHATVRLSEDANAPSQVVDVTAPIPLSQVVDFSQYEGKKVAVMDCYADGGAFMPVSNCFHRLEDHENYVLKDGDAISVYVR